MSYKQDPFAAALLCAATELVHKYGWSLDGEAGVPKGFETTEFFQVIYKHLHPLTNAEEYKKARIEALRAEIKSLEGES